MAGHNFKVVLLGEGTVLNNYIVEQDSSMTLKTGDFVQDVWGRLRQCFVMLKTSLSQSI